MFPARTVHSFKKETTLAAKTRKKGAVSSPSPKKSTSLRPRFIVNERGERVEVVLPIKLYEQLIEELEDREDIRDAQIARQEQKWETLAEVKQHLGI
jgi:hypothetical protein